MIISLSRDGTFYQWPWASKLQPDICGDTLHTVTAGESISIICKKYSVSLLQIIKLNKSKDIKHLLPGQIIVVKKANTEINKDANETIKLDAWQYHTTGVEVKKELIPVNEMDANLSSVSISRKKRGLIVPTSARRSQSDADTRMKLESLEPSTLASRLQSHG